MMPQEKSRPRNSHQIEKSVFEYVQRYKADLRITRLLITSHTCNTDFQLSAEILTEAVFHEALVNSAVSIIKISSLESPVLHDVKVKVSLNVLSVQFPFVLQR